MFPSRLLSVTHIEAEFESSAALRPWFVWKKRRADPRVFGHVMSCFMGNSCWNMLEVGFPLFLLGKNHVWEKSGEFGLLETGKLQHHMSHLLRNLRIQSVHYLANFLLITSGPDGVKCNGSTAVVDPMSLRASLIDLLI